MEASNLKEVSGSQQIKRPQIVSKRHRRNATSPEGKAVRKKGKAKPTLSRKAGREKSGKLVCRYCGSDDLSPSFVKRRDRRCRKCFSKRYGSAARTKKTGGKKK